MVFVSRQAKIDLDIIVIGLLEWEKVELTVPEVMRYVDDISDICYYDIDLYNHIYVNKIISNYMTIS